MAKKVKVHTIPPCDTCRRGKLAKYNAPLHAYGQQVFGAAWASMCGFCFFRWGLDTSVTEEYTQHEA